MNTLFTVKVVTPEKVVYEHLVYSVTLPTDSGEITLLPNHQSVITTVTTGEMKILDDKNHQEIFFVDTGVAHFDDTNTLVILIDQSESVHEIDIDHAQKAYERAHQLKEQAITEQEVDFARFESLIERELGRVKIARKYHK